MMRKKIVSLCMALALCLSLLPVTALAADGGTVYVGGVTLSGSTDSPAYATTDDNGTVTTVDASADKYNIKWDGSTLTLDGAKIKGGTSSGSLGATVGIYAFSKSGDVSLNIALKGVNEIFDSSHGIWVYSPSTNAGNVTLTIEGEGSLNASGSSSGILVQSNSGDATLTIQNADVTAENSISSGDGVTVRAGSSSSASLSVDGGSLTATGKNENGAGIRYTFGSSNSGSGTPSLTVSGNAMVKASGGEGGISDNSSADIQIGVGDNSSGGIVFDGNKGTVYGSVTLQEDLTIGEGESLDIPSGASLTIGSGATLTNEGTVTNNGTLTNNGTINNSGTLTGTISGNAPPSITTTSPLARGTVGTEYSQPLTADGSGTITWSLAEGSSLPDGLNLSSDGTITGTPTAQGESTFTVKATNDYGSNSKSLSITIGTQTNVPVTGVSLNTSTLNLVENETDTLTATVEPSNATNKDVTWESSNTSVATVDASGLVTAVSAGTATITVTTKDGNKTATCAVTVTATTVPVSGVSLNKDSTSLYVGDTETLTATITPDNATNKNVTWSSDDTSVATVDTSGLVTAVGAGTATITVTTVDQSKTATCEVTVAAATVPVTGVTLSQNQVSLYYNRTPNTLTLTATVAPANATNKAVTWTSSNPSVATVENGVVTALACGTAVITATAADGSGASASCTVTVSSYLPPANPNYKITVEATQGGTVTADPTAAKAGATVTLTPVPHRGYQVGTVAVTDRFGDAVAVTEQADGTYTFTMPNGQVTVTVTFEQAPLPFHDVTEEDWFYDAVRYAYETGLMDGVGEGLFAPNSETTRAQLVTILYRLAGQPAVSGDLPFPDVESGTWYTDAVAWAAQNGIVNGVSDTEFAPGDDITREQLVTVLYRYAESKGYDVSASADLSGYPDAGQVQDYAQPAMAWAVAEGIVEGVDGNLNPAGNATRAQIATILMRFCEGIQP